MKTLTNEIKQCMFYQGSLFKSIDPFFENRIKKIDIIHRKKFIVKNRLRFQLGVFPTSEIVQLGVFPTSEIVMSELQIIRTVRL